MSGEVIALIIISIFQMVQTILMSMGMYILKDMKDRIARLESIEMGKGIKTHG